MRSWVGSEGMGCGNVIVVQPRLERACWCSGRTNGRGEGMSDGLVSMGVVGGLFCLGISLLLRPRNREMNFVTEDERSC